MMHESSLMTAQYDSLVVALPVMVVILRAGGPEIWVLRIGQEGATSIGTPRRQYRYRSSFHLHAG